jgi:multiple sugar transport system permease protein
MVGIARLRAGRRQGQRPRPLPTAWLLLAPALLVLLAMTVAPAAYLLYSSLFRIDLLGGDGRFVGLGNYVTELTSAGVRESGLATVQFVVLAVGVEMLLGTGLALLLNRRIRERNLVSALFILPLGVAPVVSALVFRQLLDPNTGWVDFYLRSWHLMGQPVAWLSSPVTAWVALVLLDVWQWTPFVGLILLAGLQGVPGEVREAAEVDGAGAWSMLRHVTLPLLRPFLAVALLLRTIEAFKTFGTVKVLTGGGPSGSTELINLTIFRVGLQDFDVGAAAALGVCFLLLLSIVVQQLLRVFARSSEALWT